MKVISKYKDFYDYLTGIYGEDPKLVLDRREYKNLDIFSEQKIVLYICGKRIEGFYDGESFYYGEELLKIGKRHKYASWRKNDPDSVVIEYKEKWTGHKYVDVNIEIVDDKKNYNKLLDCPIIFDNGWSTNLTKFPILYKLGIPSFIPPEEMFKMLTEWLSNRISESENVIDNRNDVDKLLSKGFDKKESFRPKIKL